MIIVLKPLLLGPLYTCKIYYILYLPWIKYYLHWQDLKYADSIHLERSKNPPTKGVS